MTALSFRLPRRKSGPFPAGSADPVTQAIARLQAMAPPPVVDVPAPVPGFTPADPAPTGPIPALALPQQPAAGWAPVDPRTMTRVAEALRAMDAPSHVSRFLADRAELPIFGAAIRETGWHGLHLKPGQGYPRPYRPLSAARWHAVQNDRITRQCDAADAALAQHNARYDEIEKQRRAASRFTPRAAA